MGPLEGYRVIELAGIGPVPMAGMLLADMGAAVTRIDASRAGGPLGDRDVSARGKASMVLDLKRPEGVDVLLRLVEGSDALIEGFRPGVTERLGVGPDDCRRVNPRLVYGRGTGWGQAGPLAAAAGHDLNYIALTGVLHAVGEAGRKPVPPLNLVADMGGGGLLLAFGVVCALLEARASGSGQIVDAAMIDGAALQMWLIHSLHAAGRWNAAARGANLLDGGAPFYDVYETADGRWMSVAALEPRFYANLLDALGLDEGRYANQFDVAMWADLRSALAGRFATKSRDEWAARFADAEACVAPVLSFEEAPAHPHHRARHTYVDVGDMPQPAPAPRFSRTAAAEPAPQRPTGADTATILAEAGFDEEQIAGLRDAGVLG